MKVMHLTVRRCSRRSRVAEMTICAKITPTSFSTPLRPWQAGGMEVLTPRDVPLGGLRAMTVRRTLPQRQRSLIGAWCFLDHYGPDEVADDRRHGRPAAPAHRPADGQLAVHRRDRAPRLRRPPRVRAARRAQPDDRRSRDQPQRVLHPRHHHAPRRPAVAGAARRRPAGRADVRALRARAGARATAGRRGCSSGRCSASTSPVTTYTPLLGAELTARGGYDADGAGRPVVRASACWSTPAALRVDGKPLAAHELGFVEPGADALELTRRRGRPAARARRPAVRRADRHVVELHRPRPRRGRRLPRAVGGPPRATTTHDPLRAPRRRPARGPARTAAAERPDGQARSVTGDCRFTTRL